MAVQHSINPERTSVQSGNAPSSSRQTGTEPSSPGSSLRLCKKCWRPVAPEHRYCPSCGQRQVTGDAWYFHPAWIMVLALTLLGPFAIPLVWKSCRMKRPVKIVLTILILIYTAITVYFAYVILKAQLRVLRDLEAILNY